MLIFSKNLYFYDYYLFIYFYYDMFPLVTPGTSTESTLIRVNSSIRPSNILLELIICGPLNLFVLWICSIYVTRAF